MISAVAGAQKTEKKVFASKTPADKNHNSLHPDYRD